MIGIIVQILACIVSVIILYTGYVIYAESRMKHDVNYLLLRMNEYRKNETQVNSGEMSEIVTSLILCGFISVHLLINEGKNYDDKLQSEGYLSSLTKENLEVLEKLDRKYEQY